MTLIRDFTPPTKAEVKNRQQWESYAEKHRLNGRWVFEKPEGRK